MDNASAKGSSVKNSSIRLKRTTSKEELSLNEILCLMTSNEVTQLQAQVFLEEKYGEEKVEWMRMSNEELQKLAEQAREFKRKEYNYISNKLFLKELKQAEKGLGQKMQKGVLIDNLRTSIISYELLLDHTAFPDQRRAIVNAVSSLKQELQALELAQQPRPEPAKRRPRVLEKLLGKVYQSYSSKSFSKAKNAMFDEHVDSGLSMQHFFQFLKDFRIQRKDLTTEFLRRLFLRNSKNRMVLSEQQFVAAVHELKSLAGKTAQDLGDNEFGGGSEAEPLEELDIQQLVRQGYKNHFEVKDSVHKARSTSLAPHSGRLQLELKEQLQSMKGIRVLNQIRNSTPSIRLPSLQKPKYSQSQLLSRESAQAAKEPSAKLVDPESIARRESQVAQLLGIEKDEALDRLGRKGLLSKRQIVAESRS